MTPSSGTCLRWRSAWWSQPLGVAVGRNSWTGRRRDRGRRRFGRRRFGRRRFGRRGVGRAHAGGWSCWGSCWRRRRRRRAGKQRRTWEAVSAAKASTGKKTEHLIIFLSYTCIIYAIVR